jgi:recombination DNA repair RAD52 pathway protein
METIGSKLTPILVEIENALLEFEAFNGSKPNFSDDALRAATKIFSSVLMDKIYDLQETEKMDLKDREYMAFWAGNEIRKLIKNSTGIETHDFYNDKK